MSKYIQSGNYVYGVDFGGGNDGTAYCVFKKPNWFQRHILRVEWQFKLVHSEYEPSNRVEGDSNE